MGYSVVAVFGLLIAVAFVTDHRLLGMQALVDEHMSSQQLWLLDSRGQAQSLCHIGLASPRDMGSS